MREVRKAKKGGESLAQEKHNVVTTNIAWESIFNTTKMSVT